MQNAENIYFNFSSVVHRKPISLCSQCANERVQVGVDVFENEIS